MFLCGAVSLEIKVCPLQVDKDSRASSLLGPPVQCGHDSTEDVLSPRAVADLHGVPVRQVAAGLWHTACLTLDGAVYAWGSNADGQLGTGLPTGAVRPLEESRAHGSSLYAMPRVK